MCPEAAAVVWDERDKVEVFECHRKHKRSSSKNAAQKQPRYCDAIEKPQVNGLKKEKGVMSYEHGPLTFDPQFSG